MSAGSGSLPLPNPNPNQERRQSKWSTQIDALLAQGRRNSAVNIINRLRSGSLTGWTGGPLFSNPFKSAHFAQGEGDDFNNPAQGFRLQQRLRRMSIDPSIWKKHGNASLGSVLSALYAKLLVVMGMAFPMSEVISTYVPPAFYDGFYLYLYFVSILFMGWLFSHVIKQRAKKEITKGVNTIKSRLNHTTNKSVTDGSTADGGTEDEENNESNVDGLGHEYVSNLERKKSDNGSINALNQLPQQNHDMKTDNSDDGKVTSKPKVPSSTESTTSSSADTKEVETGNDTHSEDSDDKLSPLPNEELGAGPSSPLLHRRPSPIPPISIVGGLGHGMTNHHPLMSPPQPHHLLSPTSAVIPPPMITVQPPTSTSAASAVGSLHPSLHHNSHHNLHVTINTPPGHDGYPAPSSPRLRQHYHHPLQQFSSPNTASHQVLKPNAKYDSNSSAASGSSIGAHHHNNKGKLSRTQSMESSKYDGYSGQRSHFGSFYLRMGAVAFGIGSMIYSCLEFGQFLEQEPDTKCHSYMQAITPVVRIVFTFMQMYFIFLNSRMSVSKVSWVKQFGLMHLIGTNLCVWLNVLVQETKHEILHFYDPENGTITVGFGLNYYGKPKKLEEHAKVVANAASTAIASALIADDFHIGDYSSEEYQYQHQQRYPSNRFHFEYNESMTPFLEDDDGGARFKRGLKGPHTIYECARENIMGSLVNSASPFLFPCTIEYSLICAAICYVMWKSMAKRRVRQITLKRTNSNLDNASLQQHPHETRNVHHYTVDCAGSNKGLFIGIFFLVFTIMSLILNFVLMKHHEHLEFAFWEVNLTEVTLYAVSTLAVLIGMCQMRQLRYESGKNLELDSILLIVAQSGSLMFNVFCIVGGHLTPIETESNMSWILVTPLLCLIQLLLQTLFILDASKRVVSTPELARKKPGREIVTFLLVTNLAMWLINALEKSRGDSHPHLLRFYGVWAWTIITDIAMPLAIFYRFHSTVCLCEIWKKAYKARNKFGHEAFMHV